MDASIIVVSHNHDPAINEAIRSTVDQDSELIVVIDGPEHGSIASFLPMQVKPRLYTLLSPSGGPATPRNLGASHALGRYLLFLDHDDLLVPGALAALVGAARGADWPAVVHGNVLLRHPDGNEVLSVEEYGHLNDPLDLVEKNFLPIHSAIVRRDWFERVGGFDARLAASEDWHLWTKIALEGGRFVSIEQIVGIYRQHVGSRNSMVDGTLQARFQLYDDLYSRFPNYRARVQTKRMSATRQLVAAQITAAVRGDGLRWHQIRRPMTVLLRNPVSLTRTVLRYVAKRFNEPTPEGGRSARST